MEEWGDWDGHNMSKYSFWYLDLWKGSYMCPGLEHSYFSKPFTMCLPAQANLLITDPLGLRWGWLERAVGLSFQLTDCLSKPLSSSMCLQIWSDHWSGSFLNRSKYFLWHKCACFQTGFSNTSTVPSVLPQLPHFQICTISLKAVHQISRIHEK